MARRRRSGYVEISVSDILDEIDDADLLAEVEDRGLEVDRTLDGAAEVREAYHALRCGRREEALSILDRLLNPKWTSREACRDAFVKAQAKLV